MEAGPAPVSVVGDYEILAEIGRGGMGIVYLVRQLSLGRLVALKMLPRDLSADEVTLVRFRREMRALAACDHPNIVKVIDSGNFPDGTLYYTMEYVPGANLEQVWRELSQDPSTVSAPSLGHKVLMQALLSASGRQLKETESRYVQFHSAQDGRPVPQGGRNKAIKAPTLELPPLPPLPSAEDDPGGFVRRIVALIRDASYGLQAMHELQLIHRDLKPSNLMLTPDGRRIVLMDFGLVKGQETTLAASVQAGLLGTMRYAAPEQLAAASVKLTPAADVRGLGVTLWEMLTRRRLFADAQDETQLAMHIYQQDVPLLRSVDAGFDRDLEAIVAKATEIRVADRIQTAKELADFLDKYLAGEPLPIRPPTRLERLSRWVRRSPSRLAATAAIVFALLSIGAGVWYWDAYVRTHIAYYSYFAKKWGVFSGIEPVTEDQARQRQTTFMFSYRVRRGPVTEVRAVNGYRDCTSSHRFAHYIGDSLGRKFTTTQGECRWEFKTNGDGHATVERAYDRAGRLVYELHYTSKKTALYKDKEGHPRARSHSQAVYVEFTRPETGREEG